MTEIAIQIVARNKTIAELVEQCARRELAFSGPDSLCAKVHAMGYNTNALHEMVRQAERQP